MMLTNRYLTFSIETVYDSNLAAKPHDVSFLILQKSRSYQAQAQMEFIYSEEVSPGSYDTHELANGIPLRLHKDAVKEAKGALRAQRDWNQHVSALDGYFGGLGDSYSFIRVTVPECCPERLEVISYANEYAFLYDGRHTTFCLELRSSILGNY